eukprot:s3741_g2.t1
MQAALAEVASAIVRVHALQLDEGLRVPDFSGTFLKLGSCISKEGEEAEVKVLWAGLEAVCLAHEACRDDTGKPVAAGSMKPDPALCGAPSVGPNKSSLKMTAEALGRVLWLPARSADGELLLRRAPALVRRTFLGVAAELSQKSTLPGLKDRGSYSYFISRFRKVAMPASSARQGSEQQLRWEVFLADMKSDQPPFDSLDLQERLVSRQFWEVVAKSADLRRHVCRVFRENETWLPDLEALLHTWHWSQRAWVRSLNFPRAQKYPALDSLDGAGPGHPGRIGSYFRRGAFEPIVGEAGLPYVDAPEICQPYLEMLRTACDRIRCVANFENLAVAFSCWADKEPPPMCAPKALMHALLRQALHERLMDLKKKVFIPGKGPIEAHQAVWSAGEGGNDFVRNVCKLADAPILEDDGRGCFPVTISLQQDIYGESLRGWFCDILNVRDSPGVFQLLQALTRILPAQIGGGQEGPKVKPTLLLLRQIYAELFLQLQEGFRASEDVQQLKRRRVDEDVTLRELCRERDPLGFHVRGVAASSGQDHRMFEFTLRRKVPKVISKVDLEIADLPCSKFALSNFYASPVQKINQFGESVDVDLKKFFVEVLGVKEVLTREELGRRGLRKLQLDRPGQVSADVATAQSDS